MKFIIGVYAFKSCHLCGIFCIIDSFSLHIGKSFAHENIEKTDIMKIAILPIVVIRDRIQFTKNKFNQLEIRTIARKTKLTYQI
jgi:hypothetical protein